MQQIYDMVHIYGMLQIYDILHIYGMGHKTMTWPDLWHATYLWHAQIYGMLRIYDMHRSMKWHRSMANHRSMTCYIFMTCTDLWHAQIYVEAFTHRIKKVFNPVVTLSIALNVLRRSRSASDVPPEVAILSSAL